MQHLQLRVDDGHPLTLTLAGANALVPRDASIAITGVIAALSTGNRRSTAVHGDTGSWLPVRGEWWVAGREKCRRARLLPARATVMPAA